MEYKITRSKRKTMVMYVHKDGSVEVKCPINFLNKTIEDFVLSKESWIENKVFTLKGKARQREKFTIRFSSSLLYKGRDYPLSKSENNKVGFNGNCFYMPINISEEDIKPNIIKVYIILAKQVLQNKAIEYAKIMQVNHTNVKINSANPLGLM